MNDIDEIGIHLELENEVYGYQIEIFMTDIDIYVS
jgi:hypothetical protein